MAITAFPGNLIPFQTPAARVAVSSGASARPGGVTLLEREALLDRLEVMGEVGPTAPLSFLVIQLRLRDGACPEPTAELHALLKVLGERARGLLRPIDALGRWTGTSLAAALQGAGATASAAVAARLSHHLNELLQPHYPGVEVQVYAATGRGTHALILPTAALEDIGECC
ncbi:MAG: hypothetical protein M0R74_14265 [Dehalococcoidia bacterium]|nr:hypothetical protein [Dehalococcoidia bacterium]